MKIMSTNLGKWRFYLKSYMDINVRKSENSMTSMPLDSTNRNHKLKLTSISKRKFIANSKGNRLIHVQNRREEIPNIYNGILKHLTHSKAGNYSTSHSVITGLFSLALGLCSFGFCSSIFLKPTKITSILQDTQKQN
jgi:wyosine [tRNA(Phe)-imidazoG37] synthetase (radical SAM superfamily)